MEVHQCKDQITISCNNLTTISTFGIVAFAYYGAKDPLQSGECANISRHDFLASHIFVLDPETALCTIQVLKKK